MINHTNKCKMTTLLPAECQNWYVCPGGKVLRKEHLSWDPNNNVPTRQRWQREGMGVLGPGNGMYGGSERRGSTVWMRN